jgi:hypothetical protein
MFKQIKVDKNGDIMFIIKGYKLECHQVVMRQNAYLKDAIKEQEESMRRQFGKGHNYKLEFYLPDWMDPHIFR